MCKVLATGKANWTLTFLMHIIWIHVVVLFSKFQKIFEDTFSRTLQGPDQNVSITHPLLHPPIMQQGHLSSVLNQRRSECLKDKNRSLPSAFHQKRSKRLQDHNTQNHLYGSQSFQQYNKDSTSNVTKSTKRVHFDLFSFVICPLTSPTRLQQ